MAKEKKQVVLVMFRYNPQLGVYCTVRLADVVKTTKSSVFVDFYGSSKCFDQSGRERNPRASLYGSSSYHIYTKEEAKELFDGETFNGYRISTGLELFNQL